MVRTPGLPPIATGLFGYLGYDMVRLMERLPAKNPDVIGIPDARTEILHVRLSAAERARLQAASDAEYLDESAWARRATGHCAISHCAPAWTR